MKEHKVWTMLLGRFQCKPHSGHIALVRHLLDQGKNVYIALRKEDKTKKNPFTIEQRKQWFTEIFKKEISAGRIKIKGIDDIIEVAYGRTPGWNIYEIRLGEDLEKISGTETRKQMGVKENEKM